MKTLLFVLVINLQSGESIEIATPTLWAHEECDAMQQAVWNAGSDVAFHDQQGPVPAVDAYCATQAQYDANNRHSTTKGQ